MMYVLPGTNIEVREMSYKSCEELLNSIFLTGGLVLSQVSGMTDCEPHVVQNWVKRGFLTPPKNKKYSKRQFCRIAFINFLKDVMRIDRVTALMEYINGALDDESDDLVDDFTLYCCFASVAGRLEDFRPESVRRAVDEVCSQWPDEFVRGRLSDTLSIMATAYGAARLKSRCDIMIGQLNL
ncbi:MAG: DUF1836 domain-containing protein [Oscillospiraceae bacterium]|nr:DUF1836 domain-containing protein [Oscillospiraceae bacterium]